MIAGAEVVNAKAADAWFTVDLRSTDQKLIDDFEQKIAQILREEADKVGMQVKTELPEEKLPAAQIRALAGFVHGSDGRSSSSSDWIRECDGWQHCFE